MNYQIIKDEKLLLDFIDWLPKLGPNEKFYCCLFARKKYCQDLIKSNDKTQLKRFVATKENLLNKIKQLEVPIGTYKLKDRDVPQESLVLYVMPNPRCMKKACKLMLKSCANLIYNDNDGYNIHAEALSCIQKSKSYSYVVDFDIDTKDVDLTKLKDIFPVKGVDTINIYDIVETRGGYHLLVNPKEVDAYNHFIAFTEDKPEEKFTALNWYKAIQETFPVDQSADQLIPVPGCVQSNFMSKFII